MILIDGWGVCVVVKDALENQDVITNQDVLVTEDVETNQEKLSGLDK